MAPVRASAEINEFLASRGSLCRGPDDGRAVWSLSATRDAAGALRVALDRGDGVVRALVLRDLDHLAATLASLDPISVPPPAAPAPPAPPPPAPPAPPRAMERPDPPPQRPSAPSSAARVRVSFDAMGQYTWGITPSDHALGAGLRVRFAWGAWSLGLGARGAWAVSSGAGPEASLDAGPGPLFSVSGCYGRAWWRACLAALGGNYRGRSNAAARDVEGPLLLAGGRFEVRVPLGRLVALRLDAEPLLTVTRISLTQGTNAGGAEVLWAMRDLVVSVGAGLDVGLP